VVPLEMLKDQVSPTVVGNGREPEDTTTEDCEAEPVADAVEPLPEVVLAGVEPAAVEPDPLELLHPVRTRPAAAAATANAPAIRRTSCA
jgi:hypothetical protein